MRLMHTMHTMRVQEAALFIALPHLQFCVHNRRAQRQYMRMMHTMHAHDAYNACA